jgi:serine/threonine protein kinase
MDQQFQIDHYIILQFLGKGAFGDVYEAMDQDRDLEHVAIKYIDKQKLYCIVPSQAKTMTACLPNF